MDVNAHVDVQESYKTRSVAKIAVRIIACFSFNWGIVRTKIGTSWCAIPKCRRTLLCSNFSGDEFALGGLSRLNRGFCCWWHGGTWGYPNFALASALQLRDSACEMSSVVQGASSVARCDVPWPNACAAFSMGIKFMYCNNFEYPPFVYTNVHAVACYWATKEK